MPRVKRKRRGLRGAWLTPEQEWDLLLARCWRKDGAFPSPWHRRAAWETHRDRLLETCEGEGYRPGAWWEYDAPGQRVVLEDGQEESELAALVRLGVATPEEVARFLREHEVRFGPGQAREELFRFQPHCRVQWKHERKIIARLRAGRNEGIQDADNGPV